MSQLHATLHALLDIRPLPVRHILEFIESAPRGSLNWGLDQGLTPILNRACVLQHEDVIVALLRHGCDPNAKSADSYNALEMFIIYSNNMSLPQRARIVKLLQAHGACADKSVLLYTAARDRMVNMTVLHLAFIPQLDLLEIKIGLVARRGWAGSNDPAEEAIRKLAAAHARDPEAHAFLMRVQCEGVCESAAMIHAMMLACECGMMRVASGIVEVASGTTRFMQIALRLPTELQMLLASCAGAIDGHCGRVRVRDEKLAWRAVMLFFDLFFTV